MNSSKLAKRQAVVFDKKMLSVILLLAWPTMLEQLLQTAVQYIDTAMVGSLGTSATAAVGATTTVNWLIGSSVSALGIGFLAYISQAVGAGELERAKKASGQAVFIAIVVGILFTVLTTTLSYKVPVWMRVDENIRDDASRYFLILYIPMLFRCANIIFGTVLRASGDTKSPMIVGLFVNVVNIVLNYFLIYPTESISLFGVSFEIRRFGLGVVGAAAASAAAYTVGGICMTVMLLRNRIVSPVGQRLTPDPQVLKPCLKVAIPNMLQRFATSFGYVAFASMINSLGEVAAAAHTIANTVESAFYIPGYGMQTAASTLAGNSLGAGDGKKLRRLSKTVILLEILLMTVSGTVLFIFSPVLMKIFSDDEQVIALGGAVLRMVAVSEPFYGISIVIEGMMQGLGKTVAPFIFNVSGMWCIRIAGTFVFTQLLGHGLVSAWGCMIAHNIMLCFLFSVHYLRGKWKPENI